ncbi:MAG: YceI family protein [Chloroflexi bacterium]|nr:YceI family protein [Chloroflexota bacterium]
MLNRSLHTRVPRWAWDAALARTGGTAVSGRAAGRPSALRRATLVVGLLTALSVPALFGPPTDARAAESPDGLIHITLIPGASEARYTLTVRIVGQPPKPGVCSTRDMTGGIVLTPEGEVVAEQSQITVNQRSLKCSAPLRDDQTQQLLETNRFPTATFTARSAPGLPIPLVPGQHAYQMIGDQVVRGITQTVTYDTSGDSTPDTFRGASRAVWRMSDFGIAPPVSPFVTVDDEMVAEIDVQAAVSAPPAPGP